MVERTVVAAAVAAEAPEPVEAVVAVEAVAVGRLWTTPTRARWW